MATNLEDRITGVFWVAFFTILMDRRLDRFRVGHRTDQIERIVVTRRNDRLCLVDH
jgi:hypothetical protein